MTKRNPWVAVSSEFPPDCQQVDVWFDVWASPLSMGIADQWCEPHAWREKGKWFHNYNGEKAELQSRYITHWKMTGATEIDGPDSLIWKAAGLAVIGAESKRNSDVGQGPRTVSQERK